MLTNYPSTTAQDAALRALRDQIDQLDAQLIALMGLRFSATRQVGQIKAQHHLQAVDNEREARQRQRYRVLAAGHGVEPALVESVFKQLMAAVVVEHRHAQAAHAAGGKVVNQ